MKKGTRRVGRGCWSCGPVACLHAVHMCAFAKTKWQFPLYSSYDRSRQTKDPKCMQLPRIISTDKVASGPQSGPFQACSEPCGPLRISALEVCAEKNLPATGLDARNPSAKGLGTRVQAFEQRSWCNGIRSYSLRLLLHDCGLMRLMPPCFLCNVPLETAGPTAGEETACGSQPWIAQRDP